MNVVARAEHVERAPRTIRWSHISGDVFDYKCCTGVVHKLCIVIHIGMESAVINLHSGEFRARDLVDVTKVGPIFPGFVVDVAGGLVADAVVYIPSELYLLGCSIRSQFVKIRKERGVDINFP